LSYSRIIMAPSAGLEPATI